MTFRIRTERHTHPQLDPTVWILEDEQAGAIEIWPALGFNCYRWYVLPGPREILYADPHLFEESKPTRCGFPVLFPFPNRIRDGRFAWAGREYQLPLDDPAGKNTIHGFACRHPWRVVDQGTEDSSAWLTGEFHASRDAPMTLGLWPADHRIRLTYRLSPRKLRIEAHVDNPDRVPLPFGLGYHPYFALAGGDGSLQVHANGYWQLLENVPTGKVLPVDGARDLRGNTKVRDLVLDDVLTELTGPLEDDLICRAMLVSGTELRMRTSPAFREMVVFTPPHRQAICLEPYTCTTDAINLQAHGIDAGWKVLAPGETWTGIVTLDV